MHWDINPKSAAKLYMMQLMVGIVSFVHSEIDSSIYRMMIKRKKRINLDHWQKHRNICRIEK
jgi:3-polyprenyl-4-hydroxybenzoate decarboxylase